MGPEGSDHGEEEYEVEAILNKRTVRKDRGRKEEVQYLIKWKGWNNEFNQWLPATEIYAHDLIQRYEEAHERPAPATRGAARRNPGSCRGRQDQDQWAPKGPPEVYSLC